MSPMQFMGKVAALVPPPRSYLVRFHGVFGPHSKHRAWIVAAPASALKPAESSPQTSIQLGRSPGEPLEPPPSAHAFPQVCIATQPWYRLDWATLLKRTFALDVLRCDRRGGRRKLCALISDETIADKILRHLHRKTTAPAVSKARSPFHRELPWVC